MNQLKYVFLMSAFLASATHATVPCNGFKIDFKNQSKQDLVIDSIQFTGAHIHTEGSWAIDADKNLLYTVNDSVEGRDIVAEFSFHTQTEPNKRLKLNFNLANTTTACEVSNFSKQGTLEAHTTRAVGGMVVNIND